MAIPGRSNRRTRRSRELLKIVAAGSAGLVLMGAAYQSSFAAAGPGSVAPTATNDNYEPPPPPRSEDDDGDRTAVLAGAAVAGAVGIAAAAGAFGGGILGGGIVGGGILGGGLTAGQFLVGAAHECKERYDDLPAGHQVTRVRLFPAQTTMRPGICQCFHLEAKSQTDGKWYSVTHKPESSIFVADPSIAAGNLVKMEGSKNVFCVPLGVPQTANGLTVAVLGTYSPANRPTLSAESLVTIEVTSAGGYFGPSVD